MSANAAENQSFEASLAELENLVRELEDGRLGLDDALARYEQGVGLIKRCYDQLRQAEQRILLLTGLSGDGQPVLQPFGHEATALTQPAPARRVRRKADDGE
jgi:exodeoxyribonuclease VII small subunit